MPVSAVLAQPFYAEGMFRRIYEGALAVATGAAHGLQVPARSRSRPPCAPPSPRPSSPLSPPWALPSNTAPAFFATFLDAVSSSRCCLGGGGGGWGLKVEGQCVWNIFQYSSLI